MSELFRVQIKMNEQTSQAELASLLRSVAEDLDHHKGEGSVLDPDGNTVGNFYIVKDLT